MYIHAKSLSDAIRLLVDKKPCFVGAMVIDGEAIDLLHIFDKNKEEIGYYVDSTKSVKLFNPLRKWSDSFLKQIEMKPVN